MLVYLSPCSASSATSPRSVSARRHRSISQSPCAPEISFCLFPPSSSLTLEDGSVEERIRLIRPLSRDAVSKARLAASHWHVATQEEFSSHWLKELDEIPPTRSSAIHLVTGLLLPVWKHLPRGNSKVYRLETDDGERIVGRLSR